MRQKIGRMKPSLLTKGCGSKSQLFIRIVSGILQANIFLSKSLTCVLGVNSRAHQRNMARFILLASFVALGILTAYSNGKFHDVSPFVLSRVANTM